MVKRISVILSLLLLTGIGASAQSHSTQQQQDLFPTRDSLLRRNSEGSKAKDFVFMTSEGFSSSLYRTESELTLVFLYHPDCYTCIATIQYLEADGHFRSLVQDGRLTILAVDLSEDMLSLTENLLPPKGWTLCYNFDASINNDLIYYTESFPGIYLLDKQKSVLKKNPSARALLDYLGLFPVRQSLAL